MAEDQNNQLPPVVAANLANLNPAHLTMYDYSKPTLTGAESSIVRLAIVANNFKLKPNTIQMIQQFVQFDGNTSEKCDRATFQFMQKTRTIYEERRLQIDELDEWWTNVKEKPRIHDEKHKEATNHFKVGDQIQDMGKLPSSFILRSVVNGGSHLSNFHSFSSSSNNIATHIKALSKKPMPVRGKGKKDDRFDIVDDALILFNKMIVSKIFEAISIFDEMTERGYQPDLIVYKTILKGCVRAEALDLLSEMKVKGIKPNIITYSCLIHGMCDSGQQEKATTLLNEMLDNNISLNIVTYTILIDILCKEGMISKAVETIDMMRKQGRGIESNVVTYDALVNGHCLQNEMDKARRVLQLMIEKGCAPNIVTYSTMINRYCKSNLKEALKFFQTMQNGGLELDIVPYTILIDGLCKAGHIEVAKELFRQLSDSGLKPNVYKYGVMINGLCKEGLPDEQTCFLGAWEIMTVCLIVAVIM
ncbi:pentatricopeptide repeat-containing protein At5g16640, mitochondrial-like [Gossypium arboreum]|uniref:pentatricopeptide repeat-containing protein At5g16640, mitochondrial-like n=1 Tax=Gossypium arboreum TaxID=29729 RepID=UPI0022F16E86|nr:pentatricopeptide repeat-containing protein At5g16640, mitochondrial-like [Gossypium arboreum]